MAGVSTGLVYRGGLQYVSAPGKTLWGIYGYAPVSGFLWVYDSASGTAPTIGTSIPVQSFHFNLQETFFCPFSEGLLFTNGIWLLASKIDFASDNTETLAKIAVTHNLCFSIRYS